MYLVLLFIIAVNTKILILLLVDVILFEIINQKKK
jgi:hypothetical protein